MSAIGGKADVEFNLSQLFIKWVLFDFDSAELKSRA